MYSVLKHFIGFIFIHCTTIILTIKTRHEHTHKGSINYVFPRTMFTKTRQILHNFIQNIPNFKQVWPFIYNPRIQIAVFCKFQGSKPLPCKLERNHTLNTTLQFWIFLSTMLKANCIMYDFIQKSQPALMC